MCILNFICVLTVFSRVFCNFSTENHRHHVRKIWCLVTVKNEFLTGGPFTSALIYPGSQLRCDFRLFDFNDKKTGARDPIIFAGRRFLRPGVIPEFPLYGDDYRNCSLQGISTIRSMDRAFWSRRDCTKPETLGIFWIMSSHKSG